MTVEGLGNYLALRSRVDELSAATSQRLAEHITCRPGCDACCRHLSVFAVEARAIGAAVAALPQRLAEEIRNAAREAAPDAPCPLLREGLCTLYQARPIICRTHGLPLLVSRDGENSVDFCPQNFRDLSSIPGSAILDLERLNTMLTAINAHFLQSFPGPERLTLAEALLHSR